MANGQWRMLRQGQGQGQGQDQKWRQRSALQQQMVLALTLTLVLVLTLALAPSGMISKKGVPAFLSSTVVVVVVVVVVRLRDKFKKHPEFLGLFKIMWDLVLDWLRKTWILIPKSCFP